VDVAQALGRALLIVSVAVDATRRPLAEAAVAAAVQDARQRGADARGQARTGRPHEALLAASRECGCSLAVIGRHGPQSIARAWIGSVAQKVTGLAEGPVLIHVPNA
jgi:nucleotide-binding universal stress UspA family protein